MMDDITGNGMNDSMALDIIDGFIDASEMLTIKAWQHIIDTGLCWKLQGRYGRTAMTLIEDGVCLNENN